MSARPAEGSARPCAVVMPIKSIPLAKSRLILSPEYRELLAQGFAMDTIAACLATPSVRQVIVVTDGQLPAAFRELLSAAGTRHEVVLDPGEGLNAAIRAGAQAADGSFACLALLGDLPCLTPDDLHTLLQIAPQGRRSFVPDAAGVGSTCLLAPVGQPLSPAFGARSRAAHKKSGASEINHWGLSRMRRDVDTEVDLADAVRLGVGPHTSAALLAMTSSQSPPSPWP